mgnify:FL=1
MAESKKPTYEPLDCDDMERSILLCNGVEYLIDEFQREINCKEPNQLYKLEYQSQLLKIADNLEELLHRLTYLADKHNKEFYFQYLFAILKSLSTAPNVLIITAYYLDPQREFKRLVNRNTFEFELNQIIKKIQFIKSVLQSLYNGKKAGLKLISKYI